MKTIEQRLGDLSEKQRLLLIAHLQAHLNGAPRAPAGERLAAYLVFRPGASPTTSELRRFLEQSLPDYMIPSTFVGLGSLPLTPNGKLDRRALPVPDHARPTLVERFVAPRTAVERTIGAIWKEVLGVDNIGANDNFFDLGGHSILTIRVHARLREVLNADLSIIDLFRFPTISGLAKFLAQAPHHAPCLTAVQQRAEKQRGALTRRQHQRVRMSVTE